MYIFETQNHTVYTPMNTRVLYNEYSQIRRSKYYNYYGAVM